MKYLIVIVAILTLVFSVDPKLTNKQKKLIQHITEICVEQEDLSQEQVSVLEKGNTDRKIKCFSECFIKKLGFYANGKLIIDKIKEKLGPIYGDEKVEHAIEKCKAPNTSDECEKSYILFTCYREKLHNK